MSKRKGQLIRDLCFFSMISYMILCAVSSNEIVDSNNILFDGGRTCRYSVVGSQRSDSIRWCNGNGIWHRSAISIESDTLCRITGTCLKYSHLRDLFPVFAILPMGIFWLSLVWMDGSFHHVAADRSISIFETKNYSLKFLLEGHEKGVNYVAWSPDSKYLASCSDDKTARIWNCETVSVRVFCDCEGSLARIINSFSQFPTCIAYNPRGTILACSCSDETIYFFSVYTRNLEKSIFAHSSTISSIEFNASGSQLLSSSIDGFRLST